MNPTQKAIWLVESRLREPITLDDIAISSEVSPYHLTRAFAAITGYSLMRYVRARRLSEAAKQLANGATDILTVALDASYGSHEAFSRAFKEHFGLTPDQLRSQRLLCNLELTEAITMDATPAAKLSAPRFTTMKPRLFAGLVERHNCSDGAGIPAQWQQFQPYFGALPGQVGDAAYGMAYDMDGDGNYNYLCGFEVTDFSEVPKGLSTKLVPPQKYAVFHQPDHIAAIRQVIATIFSKWMPKSGYEAADSPMMERYGPGFNAQTGSGGFEILGSDQIVSRSSKMTASTASPGRKRKKSSAPGAAKATKPSLEDEVQAVLTWLRRHGSKATRDGMARYAIPSDKAFGVSVGTMQQLAKRLGRNHELAAALWETGWYEARMLASFVDEPARVTSAQMDRWCRDFDNWAICDTACFHLFDRTPHAWRKVAQWSGRREEFVKRAAFALLWGLTVHDKSADDEPFAQGLLLIERAADDERNFVKKAVNMALRAIGKRNRRAQRRRGGGGAKPGGLAARRGAVGRKGRAAGTHQLRGDPATCRAPFRRAGDQVTIRNNLRRYRGPWLEACRSGSAALICRRAASILMSSRALP